MKKTTLTLLAFLGLFGSKMIYAENLITVDNRYVTSLAGPGNTHFRLYSGTDRSNCFINNHQTIDLSPYTDSSFKHCSKIEPPCKKSVADSDVKGTACENQTSFYLKAAGPWYVWHDLLYGPFKKGSNCMIQKINDKPGVVCP